MKSYIKKLLVIVVPIIILSVIGINVVKSKAFTMSSEVKNTNVKSSRIETEEEDKIAQETDNQKANQNVVESNNDNNIQNTQNTQNTQNSVMAKIKEHRTTNGLSYFHYKQHLFFNGVKIKYPKGTKYVQENNDALGYTIGNSINYSIVCTDINGSLDENITKQFELLGLIGDLSKEQKVTYGNYVYRYRTYTYDYSGQKMTMHVYITGTSNKMVAMLYYSKSSIEKVVKYMLPTLEYIK